MRTYELFLRCYAKQDRQGRWYAICLDLNLDAEADTIEAVKKSLEGAISGYAETALETDSMDTLEHLLYRPASWHHFVVYYGLKTAFSVHRFVNSSWAVFKEPLPVRFAQPC